MVSRERDLFSSFLAFPYEGLTSSRKLTDRRKRMLAMMYLSWRFNRLLLYPLLCLPTVVPFHYSTKQLVALFGGNRSSKTYSAAAEMAMFVTGQHFFKNPALLPKPPFQTWVMTEDFKTAWDVQLQALLFWLPPTQVGDIRWSGSVHELEVLRPDGDVLIQFRSWTQGFKRQRGRHVRKIWFDEEPEDEDVFREAEFRTLGSGAGSVMLSCTPQSGTLSYLYDRIIVNEKKDPEVDFWILNSYDNFYLDRDLLTRLDEMSIGEDEAERDMRIKGLFAIKTGRVYKQYQDTFYDEDNNSKGCLYHPSFEIPRYWSRWRAIDPGDTVCAVGWYAVDPASGWVYKYQEAKYEQEALSEAAKGIKSITGDDIIECTVVDGAEVGAMRELTHAGIRCISDREFAANLEDIKEKTRKRAGIERVRNYLTGVNGPRLLICSTCVWTRKEFIRYAFSSKGEPEKQNDHFMDETRYFISSRPKPRIPSIMTVGEAPTYDEVIRNLERRRNISPFRIIGGE